MNCECLDNIENDFSETISQKLGPKKQVKNIAMKWIKFVLSESGGLDQVTVSEVEVELHGRKKKETFAIKHSYCPFCGTKIKKDTK